MRPTFLLPSLILLNALQGFAARDNLDPTHTLWYDEPARDWQHEALPIGNGRIGAMVFGGISRERIALNEETVWSGEAHDWNREGASEDLRCDFIIINMMLKNE